MCRVADSWLSQCLYEVMPAAWDMDVQFHVEGCCRQVLTHSIGLILWASAEAGRCLA